ncbi:MAG: hypothetical protein HY885_01700 [Deltaproteobacteria bacterium]|nr:hypothetical protein [Deltaproteobacteria bacterium]
MDIRAEKINAIRAAHREFTKIMGLERCRTCACLHQDMMAAILAGINDIGGSHGTPELSGIRSDFESWLAGANPLNLHQ